MKAPRKFPYNLEPKCPPLNLVQFCGVHGLSISVNERDAPTRAWGEKNRTNARHRFFVYIYGLAEISEHPGEALFWAPDGNGDSLTAALKDLARQLSGKTLQITATGAPIQVPKLK